MGDTQQIRVLITGANGFVGPYVGAALRNAFGKRLVLAATSRYAGTDRHLGVIDSLDVSNEAAVSAAVAKFQPSHIVHLAGLAAVQVAEANPAIAWAVHLFGTLNVANAIRSHTPSCVLISVGTGQVYGASARSGSPLDETALLSPTNVYEASKAAADLALGAMALQGLKCIRLRPFNHTGAGQSEEFVVPSFALQIARIEAGLQPPVLRVGNLDAERDFLHVEDVATAYALCVEKSAAIAPGTILNIASGEPIRIGGILERLLGMSVTPITVERDMSRMRPSDTPRYVGDARLAARILGWLPRRSLDAMLADVMEHARHRVGQRPD